MRDLFKFMNVFVDGYGYAGVAQSVMVPKIEVATRAFNASGMAGPVDIRLGRLANAMTSEMSFAGFDPSIYKLASVTEGADIPFTVKGSTEDGDGVAHAHAIKMRGFITVLDEGEWKDGEDVPLKITNSLRYYKRERDGVVLIEVDPENMIFVVNGVDQLANHRANIGR